MNQDHCATPKAELEFSPELSSSREPDMHGLWSFGLATFFGGPFAAGYLAYQNFVAAGNQRGANISMVWFGAGGLLAQYVAWHTPPDFISFMLSVGIPQLVVVVLATRFVQGQTIAHHRSSGGRMRSNWVGFGVGIATNIAIKATSYAVSHIAA